MPRLIVPLLLAALLPAVDDGTLRVVPRHDLLRPTRPFPVEVQWVGVPLLPSARIEAVLLDAQGTLGRAVVDLSTGDQAAWPLVVSPAADRPSTTPARLRVVLTVDGQERARVEVPVVTPADLRVPADAGPLQRRLLTDVLQDPSALSLADAVRCRDGLADWGAVADPVDGSLQPVRTRSVPGATRTVVILRTPPTDDGGAGARWTDLPATWRAAARAAGVTVVEVFPAGDRTWSGPGPRRVAAVARGLTGTVVAVAVGSVPAAAAGTLPVITVGADELADPSAWLRPAVAAPASGETPPLMGWSTGPVTVVVGTGEHRAAQDDNAALAVALNQAWWQWSRGVLPQQDDQRDPPATGNLVCLGSPRSNRVLASLWPSTAPVAWDHRSLQVEGQVHLRAYGPAVAWTFPRPGVPGAMVLVLDGPWRWGELPLPDGPLAVLTAAVAKPAAAP